MRVLLISTYELCHQPLHVASPAAALSRAGHEARCLDLSVEPWDPEALDWAQAVGFSVPMHTAMRLAINAARRVRREHPRLAICFYGLYAPVSRELVVGELAGRAIAGEYEPALVAWASGLASPGAGAAACEQPIIRLQRGNFELPARDLLPSLERYARLAVDGEERLVGYVEASHGCVHRCRHCPVPAVYDGRIRIVQADTVLRDIERLVAMGARHIVMIWSGGLPASAVYRSGKQPTRTPATVPVGIAEPISPSAKQRSSAHWSHSISSIPCSAATRPNRSPTGSPSRSTNVLSSKKNIPTTSTPWFPASS